MELFKTDFEDSYKEILTTLTAEQGYLDTAVEYYFERHPLRKNVLVFRNEDKKCEFYDIGTEMDCVTPLKKIQEGNQNNEGENKKRRKNKNKKKKQNQKNKKHIIPSPPKSIKISHINPPHPFYILSLL